MSQARNPNARNDWQTPGKILERVRRIDAIGLDPASCKGNPTGAKVFLTPERDGLCRPWTHSGLVFVNPEFRSPWYRKIQHEAEQGAEMVALLKASTGARWFLSLADRAALVCFWAGRVRFVGAEGPAPFDIALMYFGNRASLFHLAFEDAGWIVSGKRGPA